MFPLPSLSSADLSSSSLHSSGRWTVIEPPDMVGGGDVSVN